jgi:hypothetical protein
MPDLDQLTTVLGILGAYFAVLLVLSVSVETILEPFSWFKGLRKQVSPDEALRDIKEWLPPDSNAGSKAAAIANLSKEYKIKADELQTRMDAIKTVADETAKGLGLTTAVDAAEQKIAVHMAALRAKYSLDERKRIAYLRVISAAIGILIAYLLKIDTFDILGSLFPDDVRNVLTTPGGQVGGMLITGLAASAGSSFWHDQLGHLRAIKESAKELK